MIPLLDLPGRPGQWPLGFPLLDLPGRLGQWPLGFTKRSIWAKGGADFEGFVVAKEELIIMEEEVELNNINEYK